MLNSYQIADKLSLVSAHAAATKKVASPAEQPTNHVLVVDCSGSMSYDLAKLRTHLKNKLATLVQDGDTASLIWFSGRGEFGVLLEGWEVSGLKDLAALGRVIDRLQPIGLTGFKEPLIEVAALTKRVKNGHPFSLFFMSDGCDNQWPKADIIEAVKQSANGLAAATFVEYGFYADRQMLAAMAAQAGGTHIFAAEFDKFEPVLESSLQRRRTGAKRHTIKLAGDPIGGFAFAINEKDHELQTFEIQPTMTVDVPQSVEQVWFLSSSPMGPGFRLDFTACTSDSSHVSAAYAALSLFSVRMKPEIVFPLLKTLGDVSFINAFGTLFGKQSYSTFMQDAQAAVFNPAKRYLKGYDSNHLPPDGAFSFLDFLELVSIDEEARVLVDSPAFQYSRIGRKRVDANEGLTVEEISRVEELSEEMREAASMTHNLRRLRELQTELDALLAKPKALRFEPVPTPNGVPIASLVYNEDRPNISILVRRDGHVNLAQRMQDTKAQHPIPLQFPTQTWRAYTVVRDGLINVATLPMVVSLGTYDRLRQVGRDEFGDEGALANFVPGMVKSGGLVGALVEVGKLPILNRKTVNASTASALMLAQLEWDLLKARAAQKVYKAVRAQLAPGTPSPTFVARYGADAAAWLKEQGITDGGFSPKSVTAAATDFYMGKELLVKIKGYAGDLPSYNEVKKVMIEGKKLTGLKGLMADVITEVEGFLSGAAKKLHGSWLEGKEKAQIAETRALIERKARVIFGIVVGQKWFAEFASLDENTIELTTPKGKLAVTITMNEIEIEI